MKELINAYAFRIGYTYFKCITEKFEKAEKYHITLEELKNYIKKFDVILYKPMDWYVTSTDIVIIQQFMTKIGNALKDKSDGAELYLAFAFDNMFALAKGKDKVVGAIDLPEELFSYTISLEYMNKLNDYFDEILRNHDKKDSKSNK